MLSAVRGRRIRRFSGIVSQPARFHGLQRQIQRLSEEGTGYAFDEGISLRIFHHRPQERS